MATFRSLLTVTAPTIVWVSRFHATRAINESYEMHLALMKKDNKKRRELQTTSVWEKVGGDVNADKDMNNDSASSNELSHDGMTLAVGYPYRECGPNNEYDKCGRVLIYQRPDTSSVWTQMGQTIIGEAAGHLFGMGLSISADGRRIAVGGAQKESTFGASRGYVHLYVWNSGSSIWEQMGSNISDPNTRCGYNSGVSLSADGQRLAVGFKDADFVRIFQMDEETSSWFQVGTDIVSSPPGTRFGRTVEISSDGETVAIGADFADFSANDSGCATVFRWSTNDWAQVGQTIDGEAADDKFGESIVLSEDGNIVAIGTRYANGGSGHVRVFEWTNSQWSQMGAKIDGATGEGLGAPRCLAISSNGMTLAIGSQGGDHVQVMKWSKSHDSWIQIGADIYGKSAGTNFGRGLSLSSDGLTLAIGASDPRYTQVFKNPPHMLDILIEGNTVSVPLAPQQEYRDSLNAKRDTSGYYLEPVSNDNSSVDVSGNQWKALALPGNGVDVVKGTSLSFEFTLVEEVNFHAICLADSLQLQTHRYFCFCVANAQGLPIKNGFNVKIETTAVGETRSYSIPIWKHFLGRFKYLVFVQDSNTSDESLGNSRFGNIKFETIPPIFCMELL